MKPVWYTYIKTALYFIIGIYYIYKMYTSLAMEMKKYTLEDRKMKMCIYQWGYVKEKTNLLMGPVK